MARTIDRLDVMIAYSCNLSCAGCISVSDRPREGIAPAADVEQWLAHWSPLITPAVTTLFGGEPCLHPRLVDICAMIRQAWPDTVIRLITNGYLLDNFDSESWFGFGAFEMQVSIHRQDHAARINSAMARILKHRQDWRVAREPQSAHEQLSWTSGDVRIYKSVFKDFVVPYKSVGETIEPWHSDPAQAHAICGAPNTPVLYKGQLYKCPAVANVMDLTGENWFGYEPCADAVKLDQFVAGIGRPEPVCAQCPNWNQAVVIDHFDRNNVIVKQKITD